MKPDILISSGGALVRVNEKIICSDAHYWNYKTSPKERDKSWGDSIYTDFTDFKYEALKPLLLEMIMQI